MAEVPEMEVSKKRHLTPASDDMRAVLQKRERTMDKSEIRNENDEMDCEKNVEPFTVGGDMIQDCKLCDDDLNLSVLFSQPHDGDNVNSSCGKPASVSSKNGSMELDASYDFVEKTGDSIHNPASYAEMQDMTLNHGVDDNVEMENEAVSNLNMEVGPADNIGKSGDVSAKVKISKSVLKALKVKDNAFVTKLAETGCTVQLPKKQKKAATVFGSTIGDVQLACKLLKSVLATEMAERPQLTHFVSLRLTHTLQRERFAEFQARVRDIQPDRQLLPDRLLQRPEKLHISLSMLQLPDETARQAARDVLEDYCRQLSDQPPLDFRLRGLGTFGSASRTRVLYSRPERAERLQAAAELLHVRLSEAGLTAGRQDDITLHATLLNTTFLRRGAAGRRWRKFRGFDHGPIVEQLGEFDFGEVRPEAFEISSLTEKADDGYYASIGRGTLLSSAISQLEESSERPSDDEETRVACSAQECPPNDGGVSELPQGVPNLLISPSSTDTIKSAG